MQNGNYNKVGLRKIWTVKLHGCADISKIPLPINKQWTCAHFK